MARLAYSACLLVVLLAGGSPVSGVAPMGRCGVRPSGIRMTLRGGAPHVIGEDGAKQEEAKEDEEMGEEADDEDEEEIWKHKTSPLLFAAAAGDLDEVKRLLVEGADVNAATRKKGEAPLHVAAKRGHLEVTTPLVRGRWLTSPSCSWAARRRQARPPRGNHASRSWTVAD